MRRFHVKQSVGAAPLGRPFFREDSSFEGTGRPFFREPGSFEGTGRPFFRAVSYTHLTLPTKRIV